MKKRLHAWGYDFSPNKEIQRSGIIYNYPSEESAKKEVIKELVKEYKNQGDKASFYQSLNSLDVYDLGYVL